MAQNKTIAARMETLEDRQFFSVAHPCVTTAAPAPTGTLNVSYTGQNPTALVDFTRNGAAETMNGGAFLFTRSTTDGGTYAGKWAAGKTIETFCIEPDQDLNWAPAYGYTVTDLASSPPQASTNGPLGAKKADQIRELWGRFHGQIGTCGIKGAAFQMAIWEIACDSDRNLSTGTFSMNGKTANDLVAKALAQCMLNQLTGCGPKANLQALTSPTYQDQVFEVPCPQPNLCTPCAPTSSTKKNLNRTDDALKSTSPCVASKDD